MTDITVSDPIDGSLGAAWSGPTTLASVNEDGSTGVYDLDTRELLRVPTRSTTTRSPGSSGPARPDRHPGRPPNPFDNE